MLTESKRFSDRPERSCKKCGVLFSGYRCKACQSLGKKQYIEKNREKINESNQKWRQQNPEKQRLAVTAWLNRHPDKKKQYNTKSRIKNRDVRIELSREWREKNPDKVKKNWVEWRVKNSEKLSIYRRKYSEKYPHIVRARKHKRRVIDESQTQSIDPMYIKDLFCIQLGVCVYCSTKLDKYQIDHKTPVARGGGNENQNLQLLCPTCNRRKGAKTDGEYRSYLNAFV